MTPPKLVDYLLYEVEGNGICWIRLNRPERMNAVIGTAEENSTVVKVGEYMRAADDDPKVRVIVLTGVGRAFCAGVDVRGDIPPEVIGERLVGNRNEGVPRRRHTGAGRDHRASRARDRPRCDPPGRPWCAARR